MTANLSFMHQGISSPTPGVAPKRPSMTRSSATTAPLAPRYVGRFYGSVIKRANNVPLHIQHLRYGASPMLSLGGKSSRTLPSCTNCATNLVGQGDLWRLYHHAREHEDGRFLRFSSPTLHQTSSCSKMMRRPRPSPCAPMCGAFPPLSLPLRADSS